MGLLESPIKSANNLLGGIEGLIKNPFKKGVTNDAGAPDFPDGLTIVEIVNGVERTKDAVSLRGNMLPIVPFTFGGSQRLNKDYYPGHSEPVVQVLGPKEADVTIHGRLKEKRFPSDLEGAALAYQEQLDAIRIRGNLIKITLGEWKRYAFLEESEFKMNRLKDIEYQLKISIVGFNPPTNCKFASNPGDLPLTINKNLLAAVAAFQKTYSTVPTSMPQSIGDFIKDQISDVANAVKLVTNFVDTVVTVAEDLNSAVNRALGLIKNARATISNYNRRVGDLVFTYTHIGTTIMQAIDFSHVLDQQHHVAKSKSATLTLQDYLAQMQAQLHAIAKTTPQARVRVIKGDTLQKLAIKFYNDSAHWRDIYTHNKLTSTDLVVGVVLEIPKL